jgi:hypothetical protein
VRERFLDRGEVVEDVGVVELEVVDDDQLGQVMEELAALVEEGGVVLVALDDPVGALLLRAALRQVFRQAADEVGGLAPACSKIQARSEVVVVLPCTAIGALIGGCGIVVDRG